MKLYLKKFAKKALIKAMKESQLSMGNFSEEALRYIVLEELRRIKFLGEFPNKIKAKYHIYFEYNYKKFKTKKGVFRPDIASIVNPLKPQIFINTHPLAIELKITSEIRKDIVKCREYISSKKGEIHFEYAMLIVVPSQKKISSLRDQVNVLKTRHSQMKSLPKQEKILFCWCDPEKDFIDTFWIR